MSKNDNAHSLRLTQSIANVAGLTQAEQFAKQLPLSKSASVEKKFDWASAACDYLADHFDEDTVVTIRKSCRCNDGKSIADKLLRYLNASDSLPAFVDAFNQGETFASLTYVDEHMLHLSYPECYCACVKRIPGRLPQSWCACTLGNAEAIFARVFRKPVYTTLLESIKTGGDRCVIQVEW